MQVERRELSRGARRGLCFAQAIGLVEGNQAGESIDLGLREACGGKRVLGALWDLDLSCLAGVERVGARGTGGVCGVVPGPGVVKEVRGVAVVVASAGAGGRVDCGGGRVGAGGVAGGTEVSRGR